MVPVSANKPNRINKHNLYDTFKGINNNVRNGKLSKKNANQRTSNAANQFETSYEARLAELEKQPGFAGHNTTRIPTLKRSALKKNNPNGNYFSSLSLKPANKSTNSSNYFGNWSIAKGGRKKNKSHKNKSHKNKSRRNKSHSAFRVKNSK